MGNSWVVLALLILLVPAHGTATNFSTSCNSLVKHVSAFKSLNTTITNSTFFPAPAKNVPAHAPTLCQPTADITVPLCRIQFIVKTSDISAITAEMWIPTHYTGRSLSLGNGGLAGCIDYDNLAYGSSKGFAAIASNNGHDGQSGAPFLNNSQILADYITRSVHIETLVGKAIVQELVGFQPSRSYYSGCSTGGRQAFYSAFHFPDDFDGIIAGAPGTDWNNLLGAFGLWESFFGATTNNASIIDEAGWALVVNEKLKQCDELDGLRDGIISEGEGCDFRPEELQCPEGQGTGSPTTCLSRNQVTALKLLYNSIYGLHGEYLFPSHNVASTNSSTLSTLFNGQIFQPTEDWVKYVVKGPNFNFSEYGVQTIEQMNTLNPDNIATFDGDLTPFRKKGGKVIQYHGQADPLIPPAGSKLFYNQQAFNLGLKSFQLDEFYRLFLIAGMTHCTGGLGSPNFGQDGTAVPSNPAASNVLDDIVNWVENGIAPDEIIGASDDGKSLWAHCRYPQLCARLRRTRRGDSW